MSWHLLSSSLDLSFSTLQYFFGGQMTSNASLRGVFFYELKDKIRG